MSETRTPLDAVAILHNFWAQVWQSPQNPDAIDDLVTEDFVISSGGTDIATPAEFKKWVIGFQESVRDLEFEAVETFQNADGTRVVSRWVLTGRNNGYAGTEPCGSPIRMTGVAVWAVREDGKLAHNWVERNALEVVRDLAAA
jgi:SnoaL-like polyketide cyclase